MQGRDRRIGGVGPLAPQLDQSPRLLRVVVVDDDPATVMTLVSQLRSEGFDVTGYGSGAAALKALRAAAADVVICDLSMPAFDGWDLARELRKDAPRSRHPLLIAIAGAAPSQADRAMAESSGFNYYLTRPFDPKRVLQLIQQGF